MLARALFQIPRLIRDSRRIKAGKSVAPRLLTYTVTFRCNARCIMCDSWKLKGHHDLEIEEIESIFRQLPRLDAVRLTGGEPFVRTDLLEIVELVVRYLRPFGIHITSNGFLTDRIIELCEKRSRVVPLQIMISMDGLAEQHNHIRGNKNAFGCAMKTIESLIPLRRKLNLDLVVNQTIVDAEGMEQYKALHAVLKPKKIRHQVVMAYDASATYALERGKDLAPKQAGQFTTFGAFSPEMFEGFFMRIRRDLRSEPWWARRVKEYYLKGMEQRLSGEGMAKDFFNPKCVALRSHIRIFPNGDIPTCQFNSRVVGNLRQTSFHEIWESDGMQQQREWVDRCAGCWAECEVIPSAIYSLDILRRR